MIKFFLRLIIINIMLFLLLYLVYYSIFFFILWGSEEIFSWIEVGFYSFLLPFIVCCFLLKKLKKKENSFNVKNDGDGLED